VFQIGIFVFEKHGKKHIRIKNPQRHKAKLLELLRKEEKEENN
jgi:hypothetical protein